LVFISIPKYGEILSPDWQLQLNLVLYNLQHIPADEENQYCSAFAAAEGGLVFGAESAIILSEKNYSRRLIA